MPDKNGKPTYEEALKIGNEGTAPTGTPYGTLERRKEVFGNNPAYGVDYDPGKFYALYGRSAGPEDKLGQSGLMSLVAGGGYFPGEKERLNASMSREIGARSTLESQLLNERGANMPGGGSSGFSDSLYANVAANARNALAQYNLGLEESGQQRRYGALSQLYGAEQDYNARRAAQKEQKRAAWMSVANNIIGAATDYATGKASSIAYKTDVKPLTGKKPGKQTMLAALKGLDLKSFKYKEGIEPQDDGKEHMGVIAEEAPDEIKSGPDKIDLADTLFMTIGALRELSDKVDRLSGLGALKEQENG